eukprot:TRINITY_DN687_c0_g2_i4.p1 TRINITY_DN687_c0_g2~~TRINITY_DN687_c0_g2_i4.p1  ORF type:complete len:334 (-),score=114.64 TRINITY_DN687_c0_g2_i4:121-999(-)
MTEQEKKEKLQKAAQQRLLDSIKNNTYNKKQGSPTPASAQNVQTNTSASQPPKHLQPPTMGVINVKSPQPQVQPQVQHFPSPHLQQKAMEKAQREQQLLQHQQLQQQLQQQQLQQNYKSSYKSNPPPSQHSSVVVEEERTQKEKLHAALQQRHQQQLEIAANYQHQMREQQFREQQARDRAQREQMIRDQQFLEQQQLREQQQIRNQIYQQTQLQQYELQKQQIQQQLQGQMFLNMSPPPLVPYMPVGVPDNIVNPYANHQRMQMMSNVQHPQAQTPRVSSPPPGRIHGNQQ